MIHGHDNEVSQTEIEARGGDHVDWDKTVAGQPLRELKFLQPEGESQPKGTSDDVAKGMKRGFR